MVRDPPPEMVGTWRLTELNNLVSLCRVHHRLIHHSGWIVRIRDGLPEFIPPKWIDPLQVPRRNPQHDRVPARRQGG
jgi:hypothetical protein